MLKHLSDKDVKTTTEKQAHVRENFRKYGLFIASVAEAKTPNDVKDAISAFALPKGSSRIKKETASSFGINSYVGIYHTWNKDYTAAQIPAEETGLTAPIGFSYNRGHFLGGSLTAYAEVLDIGAIFSYKLTSGNNLKSDIQLGLVFSPSLGLIYGLPILNKYNIPLSLGANMQWGPRLKGVSDAGNSYCH
ncbi:hypothetical protein [Mucilaginibacter sp.]|uniref:hypothetical protein n=1 Tax=Mucilaginibacter sp. TaxID=1882438 RepID=UPI00263A2EDA|nr:hypothetical protein [Mucilaginibacter sp.]MDB4923254.1 hypothetical protein [Mucilaginibacter sp.]